MDIKSMLNWPSGDTNEHISSPLPYPTSTQHHQASVIIPKRQKVAKDAPVFSEGNKTIGHVNYPPHEAVSESELETRHREFRIYPLGQICRRGVRHIPYNSDKKDFLEKTGRDAFEVFQYTYKRPGEDREYVVVWDYNVGLVRMTPFFKSCKYSKTVPAKALRENPGMKDISYSITGGALVCQGYWMPYQAAKEIAATFCWDIRWALTPIFGNDFPQLCRPPQHPGFAKFVIDPLIVRFCTTETARFRKEGASYQLSQSRTLPTAVETLMPVLSSPFEKQHSRPRDLESGYGSDADRSDKSDFSPQVSPRSQYSASCFTPVNRTGSPTSPHTTYSWSLCSPVREQVPLVQLLPTSNPDGCCNANFRKKRSYSEISHSDTNCIIKKVDSPQTQVVRLVRSQPRNQTGKNSDLEAAEVLMSLGVVMRDTTALPEPKRIRRGSRF